jgi:hypothetical protein
MSAFAEQTLAAKIACFWPKTSQTKQNLVLVVFAKVFVYLPKCYVTASQLLKNSLFKALIVIYRC